MTPSSVSRALAIALLAFLFATNIYRARSQSITCDEAFTYHQFLSGPASRMLTNYDANHHILHTFLCKASISLCGLSELTLRLPSLLGGLLYFVAVYRLSRYLYGLTWLFLLSVVTLSLNPFILDQLSSARGYGLALAFCLWGHYHLLRYSEKPDHPFGPSPDPAWLAKAATCLALSVASNLTFLFPNIALAVVFVSIVLADAARSPDRSIFTRQLDLITHCFYLPGITTAVGIMIVPLLKAERHHYYIGVSSLAETSQGLIDLSLLHDINLWDVPRAIVRGFVPAVLVLAAVVWPVIARAWIRAKSFRKLGPIDQFLFLTGGAAILTLAISVAAHYGFGVMYPIARTGLYWILFFMLISLGLSKKFANRKLPDRLIRMPLLVFLTLCGVWFAVEFNTGYYADWRYDAGTKRMVHLLRDKVGGRKVRLGVSWVLEPSVNFYREIEGLDWMEAIDLRRRETDLDYFLVVSPETALVKKQRLTPLYNDRISGAVLAAPER